MRVCTWDKGFWTSRQLQMLFLLFVEITCMFRGQARPLYIHNRLRQMLIRFTCLNNYFQQPSFIECFLCYLLLSFPAKNKTRLLLSLQKSCRTSQKNMCLYSQYPYCGTLSSSWRIQKAMHLLQTCSLYPLNWINQLSSRLSLIRQQNCLFFFMTQAATAFWENTKLPQFEETFLYRHLH